MTTASPRLKQELTTYLLLTFGLSSIFYFLISSAHTLSAGGGLYVPMLMWCPGVSALLTRLLFQRNMRGEGWAWGPTRYELAGYALPIAYAACAYGAVWIFDFGGVDLSKLSHGRGALSLHRTRGEHRLRTRRGARLARLSRA